MASYWMKAEATEVAVMALHSDDARLRDEINSVLSDPEAIAIVERSRSWKPPLAATASPPPASAP